MTTQVTLLLMRQKHFLKNDHQEVVIARKESPITLIGHNALQAELETLIKVDRENIKSAIAEARALGDLKENSEYHAAKEKQSHIEGRILLIQGKLANCIIIDVSKSNSSSIVFGATVTLFNVEKEEKITYQIVGEDEANLKKGKISLESPLGRALIGKEEGDEVIVKAPKGDIEYEVESIKYC